MSLKVIFFALLSGVLLLAGSVSAQSKLNSSISLVRAKDSAYTGYKPSAAYDGSLTTFYKAKKSTSAWIVFKLNDTLSLSDVKIAWGLGSTYKYIYDVKVSKDSSSWTTVHSKDTSGGVTTLESNSFTARDAKYIRIDGLGAISISSGSRLDTTRIAEVEIWGTSATVTAPSITSQPSSVTVSAGETATFSVVASGSTPLTYQWKKGSSSISGATSASYTTAATTSSDNATTYSCVVTNSAGSVTSNAATLTVATTDFTYSLIKTFDRYNTSQTDIKRMLVIANSDLYNDSILKNIFTFMQKTFGKGMAAALIFIAQRAHLLPG